MKLHDLHAHLSGSAPTDEVLTGTTTLHDFLAGYFPRIEHKQSCAEAVSTAVTQAIMASDAEHFEIRLNPFRRVAPGFGIEDVGTECVAGIQAAAATLHRAGRRKTVSFILTVSREDGLGQLDAAVREVLRPLTPFSAIDIAGIEDPEKHELDDDWFSTAASLFREAASHKVGITYHVGEGVTEAHLESVLRVIHGIRPRRIGHGVAMALSDHESLYEFSNGRVLFELCPTANRKTGVMDHASMCALMQKFSDCGIWFNINTDNAFMLQTSLFQELGMFPFVDIAESMERAASVAFKPRLRI